MGKGEFGRAREKGKVPLFPRARSRALNPFPFPFERLPLRPNKNHPLQENISTHTVFFPSLCSLFSLTVMETIEIIEYQPLFDLT